jgi:hypothetical protein
MPQHVGMDSERHLGGRAKPRHHPAKGNRRHRSAALAHEDISSGFLLALETAQGAKFDAGQGVDGRNPILESIDVQSTMVPAPRGKPPQISPIFISDKVTLHVSREKDGKSGLLYAQSGRFQNRAASRGACAPVPRRYV